MQSPANKKHARNSKTGPKQIVFHALAVVFGALAAVLPLPTEAQPLPVPLPGDVGKAPLSDRLKRAIVASISEQLLDPGSAEIRFIVHFPGTRSDNGRVCGEVIEPGTDKKPQVRTFFSIYTRAGRVLTRLENEPFSDYLASDTVFKNCRPRL